MTDLYAAPHRTLQDQFDSRQLADAVVSDHDPVMSEYGRMQAEGRG